jgi:hypothetical protein
LRTALGAADPGIGKDGNRIPAVALGDGLKLALLIFDCRASARPGFPRGSRPGFRGDFGIGLATKSPRLTLGMITDATGLAPKLIPALKPINSA